VLSSKTAGTVARDGCKQGLAVYSVRSWTKPLNAVGKTCVRALVIVSSA